LDDAAVMPGEACSQRDCAKPPMRLIHAELLLY